MKSIKIKDDDFKSGIIYLGIFSLLGIFGYLIRATHGFTAVPGDLGDARFNSIILEHVYKWLIGDAKQLWSPRFFFPYPGSLAFSDNHFGSVAFYALARLVHYNREQAFDLWFCAGYMLTFFAGTYAFRAFGFNWLASTAAAFIFAFALPSLAQDGHAQLVYRFAIPLAVLESYRIFSTGKITRLPHLLIWIALQFFCSIYLGFFLSMLVAGWAVTDFIIFKRSITAYNWRKALNFTELTYGLVWAVAAVLWVGLLCMLYKYHAVAKEYHFIKSPGEIESMLPRLGSYLIADRSPLTSWFGSWIHGIPMRNEHQMFFGLGAILLSIAGIFLGLKKNSWMQIAATCIGALILLMILTISIDGYSLYDTLLRLPGFNSIRAVTRISLIMMFCVSLLGAIGIHETCRVYHNSVFILSAGVILLASLEVVTFKVLFVPISAWNNRLIALNNEFHSTPHRPNAIIYGWSSTQKPWLFTELDTMMFAQNKGLATVNGYSGNLPSGFGLPNSCENGARRLIDGSTFLHLQKSKVHQYLARLVALPDNKTCLDWTKLRPYKGPLPDSVFKGTSIKIVNQEKVKYGYEVTIKIMNDSKYYLPAISTSNNPVQLSWQFVPIGNSVNMHTWNTRQPLSADVLGGHSYKQKVFITPPSKSGKYKVVFDMVQDGVSWFHDKGMKVAVSNKPIVVH